MKVTERDSILPMTMCKRASRQINNKNTHVNVNELPHLVYQIEQAFNTKRCER
jgi:CMP-N-acetylneuraminic acid synthetase